jgi:uncharacterized protein (TIRG00374 family)
MSGSSDLEPQVAGEEQAQGPPESTEDTEPSSFAQPRRIAQTLLVVLILVGAIYVLLPKIVGLDDALATLDEGNPWWIALAVVFNIGAFAAYVALFRGVVGERVLHLDWSESYQITMAGLAATRLFSAGGAGGIILTYWALRKAGMERRQSACRMVAFLALLYGVYLAALVVFGILLRTNVLPGKSPIGLTIVPAALAAAVIAIFLLIALIPEDFERRLGRFTQGYRFRRFVRRLATAPATVASGTRTALAFVRNPRRGGLAVIGAIGFWAANIAILWASFEAFSVDVPIAVLVQGFFVGMAANLFPGAPGGVGAVDAGLIGAFVLFGLPGSDVFAAVLIYRLIAFWLPIPPGVVAFLQLRKTAERWERERKQLGAPAPVGATANPGSDPTILQKVK